MSLNVIVKHGYSSILVVVVVQVDLTTIINPSVFSVATDFPGPIKLSGRSYLVKYFVPSVPLLRY